MNIRVIIGGIKMAIPTFQDVMLPILKLLADGQSQFVKLIVEQIEQEFNLTD